MRSNQLHVSTTGIASLTAVFYTELANEILSDIPITETVALADPSTVFGGTLRSKLRDRFEAKTR